MEKIFKIFFRYAGRPFFDKEDTFLNDKYLARATSYTGYIILRVDSTIIGYTHYGVIEGYNNCSIEEKIKDFSIRYGLLVDFNKLSETVRTALKLDNGIIMTVTIIPVTIMSEDNYEQLNSIYENINVMLDVLSVNEEESYRKRHGIY